MELPSKAPPQTDEPVVSYDIPVNVNVNVNVNVILDVIVDVDVDG